MWKLIKKNKKEVLLTIIILILITGGFILMAPLFITDNYEVSNNPKVIIFIIILVIVIIILSKIMHKKQQKLIDQIIQEIPPRMGIITDMFIYVHITGRGTDTEYNFNICPIVKDLNTNKLYVSLDNSNINRISYGPSIFSPMSYVLKSLKGNEIKIGQHVNIHIKEENDKFEISNNMILINGDCYQYMGKISDFKISDYTDRYLLFNEVNDNFINEMNDLNVFEGIVDFDIYN